MRSSRSSARASIAAKYDYERGFPKKAEINAREVFSDNAKNAKLRAREQEDDYGKESETRYLASAQEVRHHDKDKEADTETCNQKAQPNSQLQRNNRKSRNQVHPVSHEFRPRIGRFSR